MAVIVIHEELIAEHGGKPGLRDPGLLLASLARPRHLFSYSENARVSASNFVLKSTDYLAQVCRRRL